MSRDDYRLLTDIDEIMSYTEKYVNLDKWMILNYFATVENSPVFNSLLKSKYFTPEELYDRFITQNKIFPKTDSARKLLAETISPMIPWHSLSSIKELFESKNRYILNETDFLEKLKQFANGDIETYNELLKTQKPSFYLSKLSEEELLSSPQQMIDYISQSLNANLKSLESQADNQKEFDEFLKSKKLAILKCALNSIEHSIDIFRLLKTKNIISTEDINKVCSKEEIEQLPNELLDFIKTGKDAWKFYSNPEIALYHINKEDKWIALEYFAEHNERAFKAMVSQKISSSFFTRKLIYDRYKNCELSILPKALQDYIIASENYYSSIVTNAKATSERLKKESQERSDLWVDKNGNLIEFFKLSGTCFINTKEDYIKIAQIFKDSGLSTIAFCHKYKISDIDGFRQMLKKVSSQDSEFNNFYSEFTAQKRQEFINNCQNFIANAVQDPHSIAALISKHSESMNLAKIIEMAKYTSLENQLINNFAENIIQYYYNRISSCDCNSYDINEINKRLTHKEITFIANPKSLEAYMTGKNINFGADMIKSLNEIYPSIHQNYKNMLINKTTGISVKMGPYSSAFFRKPYMQSNPSFQDESGKFIYATDKAIDMALCYANSHHLFRTYSTMVKIIKNVALGQIKNEAETNKYLAQLKRKVDNKIEYFASVEDYFNAKNQWGD